MDTHVWNRLWRRAFLVASVLRFVPYVRMVGLNGSMATGTANEESDIDFLVILKSGRIFSGRVLVGIAVHLLGVRRSGDKVAGRVCLNRFATDRFLDITPHNEYHARVFHNLIPLYADPSVYECYVEMNDWMRSFGYAPVRHTLYLKPSSLTRVVQGTGEALLEIMGSALERACSNWQHRRVENDPRAADPGSIVIIGPNELRFHLNKEKYGG